MRSMCCLRNPRTSLCKKRPLIRFQEKMSFEVITCSYSLMTLHVCSLIYVHFWNIWLPTKKLKPNEFLILKSLTKVSFTKRCSLGAIEGFTLAFSFSKWVITVFVTRHSRFWCLKIENSMESSNNINLWIWWWHWLWPLTGRILLIHFWLHLGSLETGVRQGSPCGWRKYLISE